MTKIPYLDEMWSITTGCGDEKVSPGCDNCYARRMFGRNLWKDRCPDCSDGEVWNGDGLAVCPTCGGTAFVPQDFTPRFHPDRLDQPLHWRKPRVVGVSFMGDLFHDAIRDEQLNDIFFPLYVLTDHTWLVLTKRPERMREYLSRKSALGSNVMLGVTVCNQKEADEKIPILLATPAARRWVSIEPMLGPVDLEQCGAFGTYHMENDAPGTCKQFREWDENGIDWVALGGETGPGARPMEPSWALDVYRQCEAMGVPFYFKALGNQMCAGTSGCKESCAECCEMQNTHEMPEMTP